MNLATLRATLGCSAAFLMVILWYFSQYPWSEFQSITSERSWTGSRRYDEAKTGDEIGASFYLGGSFVLLLAAGWIAKISLSRDPIDRLPGVITLGTALLAIVALVRWNTYLNRFPSPQTSRYGSSGHYMSDSAEVCIIITGALIIVGTLLLFVRRVPPPVSTTTNESP